MRKILTVLFLMFAVSISLHAAGGSQYQYEQFNSSGAFPITLNHTSNEIYIIKLSTPAAYVNFTSTNILTSNLTNYFYLPETTSEFVVEHVEDVNTAFMSVWTSTNIPGVSADIRIKIKSW